MLYDEEDEERVFVNSAFRFEPPPAPRLSELERAVLAAVRDHPLGLAPTNKQVIRAIRGSRANGGAGLRKLDINRALHSLAQKGVLYFIASPDNRDKLWALRA